MAGGGTIYETPRSHLKKTIRNQPDFDTNYSN